MAGNELLGERDALDSSRSLGMTGERGVKCASARAFGAAQHERVGWREGDDLLGEGVDQGHG